MKHSAKGKVTKDINETEEKKCWYLEMFYKDTLSVAADVSPTQPGAYHINGTRTPGPGLTAK